MSLKGLYLRAMCLRAAYCRSLDGAGRVLRGGAAPEVFGRLGFWIFVPPPGLGARVLCNVPHGRARSP